MKFCLDDLMVVMLLVVSMPQVSFGFRPSNTNRSHRQQLHICPKIRREASLTSVAEGTTISESDGPPRKNGFSAKHNKKRKGNPVSGDTAFLRKRTAHLLRVTAGGYQNDNGTSDMLSRGMKIDRKSFNWLIDSWMFSGELDAPDKANALLARMEELYQNSSNPNLFQPDVRSYTKVINAISRSSRPDSGEMADRVMERMESQFLSGKNDAAKPNTHTYTALVEAHANSGAEGSALRAEEICETMVQKWQDGDPDVTPTSRSFNAAINAWAKSGEKAGGQQAANLFEQMMEVYESGNQDVKPNAFNFNSVMAAWANCRDEESAERAEDLLHRMEEQYKAGDLGVKPTTVSYNAVIDAWAKSGGDDGAGRAEQLLRRMEELFESGENVDAKPNVRSFNSVINAWAKSGREDAASKAEGVLDLMEFLYETGNKDVRPDVHSFTTVINGKYLSCGDSRTRRLSHGVSINSAWARSQRTGKAERTLNLFREMIKLHEAGNEQLRPNIVAYNAVLNACAFTSGETRENNKAVEIAHSVLQHIESEKYSNPDQVTYGTFLKVIANQMPDCDSRTKVVAAVFRKCCKEGQVGNLVIQQLKAMAGDELFRLLVGRGIEEEFKIEDLPHEWRCNVVEGKWRRRKRFDTR